MNYVDVNMCCVRMNYVDVNVFFMNIVNVYLCILYCPGFEFSSLELVISYFCKKIRFQANL
jgi:hypothetical protein